MTLTTAYRLLQKEEYFVIIEMNSLNNCYFLTHPVYSKMLYIYVVLMDDKLCRSASNLTGAAALVGSVSGDGFGRSVLEFVSKTATIRNFGAYYFPDLARPNPVLSVWSGRVGDYRLRRYGGQMVSQPALFHPILENVRAAPIHSVSIERWHPREGNPRKPIYEQMGVLERVTLASCGGAFGYESFYLRDKADGWLTDEEYSKLCKILPFVHELIGLRHRIIGSENFQFTTGTSVSSLRERQVMGFSKLSQREAEVCDCLVKGMTIAGTALELGIAETTVRTFRQSAYRKIAVTSAIQLMALIVYDSNVG